MFVLTFLKFFDNVLRFSDFLVDRKKVKKLQISFVSRRFSR